MPAPIHGMKSPCYSNRASFRIRWLGTACFQILLSAGKTLIVDPFLDESITSPISSDEVGGCDFILLSHGHWDHILDVGTLSRRFHPKIFCNRATADSLIKHQDVDPALFHVVKWDQVIREDVFSLEILRGIHPDPRKEYERLSGQPYPEGEMRRDPHAAKMKIYRVTHGEIRLPEKHSEWMKKFLPGEQLNFLLTLDCGLRIYVAGSHPDPEIIQGAEKAHADITLLQVLSGDKLKGHEMQTARLAIASGCKIIVPQHHDPMFAGSKPTDLSMLKETLANLSDALFQELMPGQWYGLEETAGKIGLIPEGASSGPESI